LQHGRFSHELNNWNIEIKRSETALAHEANLDEWLTPTIWVIEPRDTCLVLGKSEREKPFLNLNYLKEKGINLTTRQSGGGAVLVAPNDILWVDVFVPQSSNFWENDITKASIWVGGIWHDALKRLDVASYLYEGKFERSRASDLVCFAGKGPGEILIDEKKILGISQRRSRLGARFQCALIINWKPEHLIGAYKDTSVKDLTEVIDNAGTSSGCKKNSALNAFVESLPVI
jgi:lipoate-protein ligase A|tara:strand:- start:20724 stop:21416 length:693 start_codon:yes stop_codon:yes gene_type:complete